MRELNWKPGESAEVSLLGDPDASRVAHPARILEFSAKRLRLAVGLPVKTAAPVRVEWDGQLLLGQVLNTEPDGFWIEVQHILLDAGGLSWRKNGWHSETGLPDAG